MKSSILSRLFCWLALVVGLGLCGAAQAQPAPPKGPLILVSIDGFRADYLQRGRTPALLALAGEGVRSTGMRPAFPSITFPNHYTLVTGLTPDHHGIVANTMVDPAITPDSRFTLGDFAAVSDARWWGEATPLWVSAEQQGKRAATMFWPGSEAPIQGRRPDLWAHFDASLTPDQRVDVVLDWLDLPPAKRPDFITLYFDEVDHEGHLHGPDSPQVDAALGLVDRAIARLRAGLQARGLFDAANLVIVADHGMAATSPERQVYLDDVFDVAKAQVVTLGAVAELTPAQGQDVSRLLASSGPMQCWPKGQIPARLRYGSNPRIPAIVCLAKVGWMITTRAAAARHPETAVGGEHGYDPATPQMAALFIAEGPAFRRAMVIPPFDNVDVQPMLAKVLGVSIPRGDGDPAALAPIFAKP